MKLAQISGLALTLSIPCTGFAAGDAILSSVGSKIDNFHAVDSGVVYRGAEPSDEGIQALGASGIKTIIDLQGGDVVLGFSFEPGEKPEEIAREKAQAESNHIAFFSRPLNSINPDFDDQSAEIDEILEIVSNPANQPVYFHCRHGKDRTGLIAALYRVFEQSCTPALAKSEMKKFGHSPWLFWIDHFFKERVKNDPRTHASISGPGCPLR